MTVTALKAENHRRMPWKNGGGVTVEIAIHPQNASVDNFDWRISTAQVAQDGAFSVFDQVDRTLSVLSGDAMVLEVEGQVVTLSQQSQPFGFAADASCFARLTGAPITDLNVMTRRGHYSHQVEDLRLSGDLDKVLSAGLWLCYCAEAQVSVQYQGENQVLQAQDALQIELENTAKITLSGDARVFLIHLVAL